MHQFFYGIATMNALFSSMAWCAAKPDRYSILAVLTFAVIWPFANGPLEGNTLVILGSTNGITVSDLLSVLAVSVALVQAVRIRRAARREQSGTEHGDITETVA
ncbi:MAG: hypothetical protein QOG14_4337 [Mycobacterium sp.]|nr:hypothetical protein [Mycobacterium sp.]